MEFDVLGPRNGRNGRNARAGKALMDMKKTKNGTLKASATDEAAEKLLWDCLVEVPFLQLQKVEQRVLKEPGRPEIVARVKLNERDKCILAEVKANGQTRLVREAIEEILAYRETYADAYGVIIAPYITPAAARLCRQEGIGYLDFGGNGLLNFDFVFIKRSGQTASVSKKKGFRSWFSPRVERLVRQLLMDQERFWKIPDLANEAYLTPNQALHIKLHLAKEQWLEETAQGFRLRQPDLLLDEWAKNYRTARSVERKFTSPRSVVETEAALASVCQEHSIPYALMGFSAAMRYDPKSHYNRVSAYVLSDLSQIISALELSEASGQGNVSLWIPYDEGVLFGATHVDHAKVTSPVQTYMDLINISGRGERTAHNVWIRYLRKEPVPISIPAPTFVADTPVAQLTAA